MNKITCPITEHEMTEVLHDVILKKHHISYYICHTCGYVCTEKPYWLEEAYSSAISSTDTGILQRNIAISLRLSHILRSHSIFKGPVIDVGAGYGILCRLLRDYGFECYATDKFCEGIFSAPFPPPHEISSPILLAFEVLEHLENPYQFIRDIFSAYNSTVLIFSTEVYSHEFDHQWWYLSKETGQHISFFKEETLEAIAHKIGCRYMSLNDGLHIFIKDSLPFIKKHIISQPKLSKLIGIFNNKIHRRHSKTMKDCNALRKLL